MQNRAFDGRAYRLLEIIDDFTKDALMMRIDRKLDLTDVIVAPTDLFILRGPPASMRSYNGPEFLAKAMRAWIAAVGAQTACIEPGSSCENGYVGNFNSRLPDEMLDGTIFHSPHEARSIREDWRTHFNTVCPHSAIGWSPPTPDIVVPIDLQPTLHSQSSGPLCGGRARPSAIRAPCSAPGQITPARISERRS